MRNFLMALTAVSLVVPASMAFPTTKAEAKKHYSSRYYRTKHCTHSGGTTGAVAGGVGGAVIGNTVGGGLLGTLGGAAAGALAGRAIDRANTAHRRCTYR